MSAKLARRPPVTGEADDANVYIADDSGKIYYSFENGATGTWNSDTPGSGSAVKAIDFYDDRKGHAVGANGREPQRCRHRLDRYRRRCCRDRPRTVTVSHVSRTP